MVHEPFQGIPRTIQALGDGDDGPAQVVEPEIHPGQFRNPFHDGPGLNQILPFRWSRAGKAGDGAVAVEILGGLAFGVGRGGPVLLTKVLVAYRGGLAGIPGKSLVCCCRHFVSITSHFLEMTSNNKHQ